MGHYSLGRPAFWADLIFGHWIGDRVGVRGADPEAFTPAGARAVAPAVPGLSAAGVSVRKSTGRHRLGDGRGAHGGEDEKLLAVEAGADGNGRNSGADSRQTFAAFGGSQGSGKDAVTKLEMDS